MVEILSKEKLCENVYKIEIDAPMIAKKAKAGQFVIVRPLEGSERIPLTIADYDRERGAISLIYQRVGKTTAELALARQGDYIAGVSGPLGRESELEGIKRACVIGGGVGCAIAYPQAKALKEAGAYVEVIAGFRSSDMIILEKEMKAVSDRTEILTDDGSNGKKGLVTDGLRARIEDGANFDTVIAIGPVPMMKFVSLLTKEYGIKTIVSMNPIMIDGTGMCGGCRLTVGGRVKFACVDGPDFDGHEVDYDELMRRNSAYKEAERHEYESFCNLFAGLEE